MKVEVVRSPRRRKTVEAKLVDGVMRLAIPATMSRREEAYWIDEMRTRLTRRLAVPEIDLERRATTLADRLDLPKPSSIVWSHRQQARWGSCTVADGRVRISSRLQDAPQWVLDYVIVHELAHLVIADHSADFWALVGRYSLAERARGYLIAKAESAG